MSIYDGLYSLAKEIDENVNRISAAADNALELQTRLPIPGGLGAVTVKGTGQLVAVELDPHELRTTNVSTLGRSVMQAIRQAEATAKTTVDQQVAQARRPLHDL